MKQDARIMLDKLGCDKKQGFASDLQEFYQGWFTVINPHVIPQKKTSPVIDQILAPPWEIQFRFAIVDWHKRALFNGRFSR